MLAGVAISSFLTLSDQRAILCYGCKSVLKEEIARKVGDVKRKISALSQKRPCSTSSTDCQPRHGRTEVSSSIESSTHCGLDDAAAAGTPHSI